MSGFRDIEKRLLEAEKIEKQNLSRIPAKKVKWLKAPCTFCSYVVWYSPKEDFKGDIRCPQCGKEFHITRLGDFE